jgi:gluconate 2-dehydrogenase gamma chain
MHVTRRDWLFGSLGSAAWPVIAAAQEHAHRAAARPASARFEFFDESTAADVAAIASQILPSDDGPGAKEAGVVFFVDRALHTFDAGKQDLYRKGIKETRDTARRMFPAAESIAALSSGQQFELVRAIEKSDFFEAVRVHTLLGFLGSPAYGGNRDRVGWKYIEFEDRMSWEPPFGHYDAEVK